MKRLLFVIGLLLMMVPICEAKKVVVLEVTREGKGWQNFFNCYERVATEFVGNDDGITYANLRCEGAGYNYCRVSREIGELTTHSVVDQPVLANAQVVKAINELIEASEKTIGSGILKGSQTKKVGIVKNTQTDLYVINANWQYNDKKSINPGGDKLVITIELDDKVLTNNRRL